MVAIGEEGIVVVMEEEESGDKGEWKWYHGWGKGVIINIWKELEGRTEMRRERERRNHKMDESVEA